MTSSVEYPGTNGAEENGGESDAQWVERIREVAKKYHRIASVYLPKNHKQSDLAFHVVETLFVSNDIQPGRYFTLENLCDALEMGRTPVRDALILLESEGLIDLRRRKGIVLKDFRRGDLRRILLVRSALESLATREAIVHGTDDAKAMLARIANELLKTAFRNNQRDFMSICLMGYQHMTDMVDNPFLRKHLLSAHTMSRRIFYACANESSDIAEVGKLHRNRFIAIADSDQDAAEAETRALMRFLRQFEVAG